MLTMKPSAGSPLIDTADNSYCPPTDQRDVARPQDGDNNGAAICDVGAVESNEKTITLKSLGANDGWIRESAENSNAGGLLNSFASTILLGDDGSDRQYRAILHFNTSILPDTAVIVSTTLSVKQQQIVGSNPFSILGPLYADMRKPAFGLPALELADFNSTAIRVKSAVFNPNPVSGWYSARFNSAGNLYVNRTGTTQLRLYFSLGDNDNLKADFVRVASGDAAAGDRPKLTIRYYVP